jgi:hypothetical protein
LTRWWRSSSVKLDAATAFAQQDIASESSVPSEMPPMSPSAIDVASLADSFGVAVHCFHAANENWRPTSTGSSCALDKSMLRSDGTGLLRGTGA